MSLPPSPSPFGASRRVFDISRPLRAGIGVWPGDTAFDFGFVARIRDGSSVNVGRIEMSVHTGAHVDAPLHFQDDAPDVASVPVERYLGPCVVADARPLSVRSREGDAAAGRGVLSTHAETVGAGRVRVDATNLALIGVGWGVSEDLEFRVLQDDRDDHGIPLSCPPNQNRTICSAGLLRGL